jgi:ferric-dicitrate binding protein FerR (iron transport regulator)
VSTGEVVDARKTRIDEAAAWALLKTANSVTVAKGKKVQTFTTASEEKEALLQQAMGPSGNLRAPTYRIKDQFVIGFNADLYEDTFN